MDTFNSKYKTWYSPLDKYQKQQYEQLEKLVLSFNKNLKADVFRAKEKYNVKVRGVIAEKTGVSLNFKDQNPHNREVYIPIKLEDRVPASLLNLFAKYTIHDIELLLHYKGMKQTVNELEYQIKHYHHFEEILMECKISEIENTIKHLNKLIGRVENTRILDDIKELGPDLLGAYFLSDNHIELYWLCIGLCSILYNIPIEDFTLIVLAHELVHGYTHIGFDKDGNNWETWNFSCTDLKIVEGFAQFYTEKLCKDYFKHAVPAFEALLTVQAEEYTAYQAWFEEKEMDKYEKVRRILLKVRKNSILKYEDFESHLKIVKEDFKLVKA